MSFAVVAAIMYSKRWITSDNKGLVFQNTISYAFKDQSNNSWSIHWFGEIPWSALGTIDKSEWCGLNEALSCETCHHKNQLANFIHTI